MIELDAAVLLKAYAVGLFPMAQNAESEELFWFDPEERGILPLEAFHVPRRLRRTIRQRRFAVAVDRDFPAVIEACAEETPTRGATWINREIKRLYNELHRAGFAHSVECRNDGNLVGGLYGVALGGAFFGESMFSRETDASKVALVHLVARLRSAGYALLDTQFVTKHLARFGATTITRRDYRRRLAAAISRNCEFRDVDGVAALEALLASYSAAPEHDSTHTS